jgi:hypothetical protein
MPASGVYLYVRGLQTMGRFVSSRKQAMEIQQGLRVEIADGAKPSPDAPKCHISFLHDTL